MKKRYFTLGYLVLSFLFGQSATAQAVDSTSLDTIINRSIEAYGGKAKLSAVQSIFMKSVVLLPSGGTIKFKTTRVANKLYREDYKFGMAIMGTVVNGFSLITDTATWKFKDGAPVRVDDSLVYEDLHLDIFPLLNYAAKGYKVTLIGKDTVRSTDTVVNGDQSYVLSVTNASGKAAVMLWVNTKTYLIDEYVEPMVYIDSSGSHDFRITTLYTDYRSVNGVMFPYAIESSSTRGDRTPGLTIVSKIEVNTPVNPKLYRPE